MNTTLSTKELEIYTDGILAERNRIFDLLEDIITELQLEHQMVTKDGDHEFANILADRVSILQELESLVKAEI